MTTKSGSVTEHLRELVAKPAWGLVRTVGSMFFLEIGYPIPRLEDKRAHGEWHFLFQNCHWRFERQHDIRMFSSEDDKTLIDKGFESLGARLGNVDGGDLMPDEEGLRISFTSGLCLQILDAMDPIGEDRWFLYGPSRSVLVCTLDGNIVQQDLDDPTHGVR